MAGESGGQLAGAGECFSNNHDDAVPPTAVPETVWQPPRNRPKSLQPFRIQPVEPSVPNAPNSGIGGIMNDVGGTHLYPV